MKFIPILFSTPMVQAILEGRKNQTRRVVKPQPSITGVSAFNDGEHPQMKCPYGQPGDVLWVRETYYAYGRWVKNGLTKSGKQKYKFDDFTTLSGRSYKYEDCKPAFVKTGKKNETGWYKRPSLFMPKEACRLFLQIKNIRVERLQDISEEDAKAEGVETLGLYPGYDVSAKGKFEGLWNYIHGNTDENWNTNPFVWVIEFERIEKPENFC